MMQDLKKNNLFKSVKSSRLFGVVIVLVGLVILISILTLDFLNPRNLMNVVQQSALKGVLAVGMTLVIIMGGIDLSAGSIASISAMFTADILSKMGIGALPLAILAALAAGVACGAFNGWMISHFEIQPFLITMGTMNLYRGLDYIYSGALSIRGMPQEWLATWTGGVPVPILIWIVVAVAAILLIRYTKYGRYIFAIGGNEQAAKLSAINTKRIKITTYALVGLASAICGIIFVGRMASAEASTGVGYELDAIAAAAIGGASLKGGKGSIVGTILGAIILSMLANGLTLLNVQAFYQTTLTGVIIIVAVLIDRFSNK